MISNEQMDLLVKIIQEAGNEVYKQYNEGVQADQKVDGTFVTKIDQEIGKLLRKEIRNPIDANARFLEEEEFEKNQDQAFRGDEWVIDPIDGTALFKDQIPIFGISVAKFEDFRPVVGVFYMPAMKKDGGHLYTAIKGQGAKFNGLELSLEPPKPDPEKGWADYYIAVSSDCHRYGLTFEGKIRAFGASAFHLALVARGLLLGAYFTRFKLWDIAAGAIILTEVGGELKFLSGKPIDFSKHEKGKLPDFVVAAHPGVIDELRNCFTT
jgi:myo-inositol-1(or 4)-monophosphatase